MYRLKIFDNFASAHFLKGYEGKCEKLHGHNWKVEAEVQGNKLDKTGMLIDFKVLRKILGDIVNEMDHCLLNDLDIFKNDNPSAESIARHIYNRLRSMLPDGISVASISVWESEGSMACYFEE